MVNVPCRQTVPPMEVADIAEAGGAVVHDAWHYGMLRAAQPVPISPVEVPVPAPEVPAAA